ncbi:MAG: 16S rRNA (guanine(966)-N(2))-methyltransferase RsmD [Candidatus Zixiibacteriota bacterium]|nr:MAG: 16S rRNA (guanine(966)-N(2))-methyltransferase RsmD [candidate division Zixibacteria bacterium]
MRITGGRLKGRRIAVPGGGDVRPSTDKLREAVFSIIGDDILGAKIADLFCGSGALGIEALSRGADYALFVDSSRRNISNLRKNLEKLGIMENSDLKVMDALKIRPKRMKNYSIVFADPPYNRGLGERLISLFCLPKFEWYGILVLEHESDWIYKGQEMEILNRKAYGDMAVSFLRKNR